MSRIQASSSAAGDELDVRVRGSAAAIVDVAGADDHA